MAPQGNGESADISAGASGPFGAGGGVGSPAPRIGLALAGGAPEGAVYEIGALRALDGSAVLKEALGPLVPAYLKLKHSEWNDYARHLTQWERETTLDC